MSSNNCGEKKISTVNQSSLMTSSEKKFNAILPKKTFEKIEGLANHFKSTAKFWYIITAICILFIVLMLTNGESPVLPIVLATICASIGSFMKLLSELVFIVLQAEKELYISAKYSYVDAELTETLIKKIDSI